MARGVARERSRLGAAGTHWANGADRVGDFEVLPALLVMVKIRYCWQSGKGIFEKLPELVNDVTNVGPSSVSRPLSVKTSIVHVRG